MGSFLDSDKLFSHTHTHNDHKSAKYLQEILLEFFLDATLSSLIFCPVNFSSFGLPRFSAPSLQLRSPLGSARLPHPAPQPGNFLQAVSWSNHRAPPANKPLSGIAVLYCMIVNVLETVVSYVLFVFWLLQESKLVPLIPS